MITKLNGTHISNNDIEYYSNCVIYHFCSFRIHKNKFSKRHGTKKSHFSSIRQFEKSNSN